jgi:hypothetical protein
MSKGCVEAILHGATSRFASFVPCCFFATLINSINMPPRKLTTTSKAIVSYDTIEVDTQSLVRLLELSPDLFSNQFLFICGCQSVEPPSSSSKIVIIAISSVLSINSSVSVVVSLRSRAELM